MSEWISCKERMPMINQNYLVWWIRTDVWFEKVSQTGDTITSRRRIDRHGSHKVCWFNGVNFNESGVETDGIDVEVVTHWQELPEPPPKEEK